MIKILLTIVILFVIYLVIDNNKIKIVTRKVTLKRKKHGKITVLHIADLHDRKFGGRLARKINSLNIDAICFTGDIENDTKKQGKHTFVPFVQSLTKDTLKLYVDGNNGAKAIDYKNLSLTPYGKLLETLGVHVVIDFFVLEKEKICFVNSDLCRYMANMKGSYYIKETYKSMKKVRSKEYKEEFARKLAYYKENYCIIGLGHFPFNLSQLYNISKGTYNNAFLDLNLCGHYHAGQFILPFLGPLFVPSINSRKEAYFPLEGEIQGVQEAGGVYQNISRGLGATNMDLVVPLVSFRICNTPQMDIIEVE